MSGVRAMALVRLRRFGGAAEQGVKAAAERSCVNPGGSRPLVWRWPGLDEARSWLATIRKMLLRDSVEDFQIAMQSDANGAVLFRKAEKRIRTG